MFDKLTFKRKSLAGAFCDNLAGKGIADATSGLFLAWPRRVGKSTFLIEDLIPEAEHRNLLHPEILRILIQTAVILFNSQQPQPD